MTPLEQRILEAVQAHNERTSFPATNADVCNLMGYRGRASAHPYLRSLLRQGLVVTFTASRRRTLIRLASVSGARPWTTSWQWMQSTWRSESSSWQGYVAAGYSYAEAGRVTPLSFPPVGPGGCASR